MQVNALERCTRWSQEIYKAPNRKTAILSQETMLLQQPQPAPDPSSFTRQSLFPAWPPPGQLPCGHRMEFHRTERALTHLTWVLGDIHCVHSHVIAQSRLHGHLTPRGSLEQPSQVPCGGRGGTMVAQASVRSREGNACATLPDGQLLEWTHMCQ